MRFLGISGSLRAASTNTALLRAIASNADDRHNIELFDGLGLLPIFNPDLQDAALPDAAVDLARRVDAADGLILSCPEYAHGIPGGLKNALDWLVGGSEAAGKPVMLVHASHRSAILRAALREVLKTMSLSIFDGEELELPLLGKDGEATATVLAEPPNVAKMRTAVADFAAFISRLPGGETRAFTVR